MEEESLGLFFVGSLPVTAYALCLATALGIGLIVLCFSCKKARLPKDAASLIAVLALPLGLIGARLFYVTARIGDYLDWGRASIFRLWDGGYAIWGAIGGAALAGVLAARRLRIPISETLDAMAAPGALTVCLCRLAEYFSGEGVGPLVEEETFWFFPLSIYRADYDEWYYAIFMAEALAALVIFLILLRSSRWRGERAKRFLILYSACQVLLESLRRDSYLRWLFVRVSQLTAVLVMTGLILFSLVRLWKQPSVFKRKLLLFGVFALCVGVCVALEFAVDKAAELPNWLCYSLLAAACAGLGVTAHKIVLGS